MTNLKRLKPDVAMCEGCNRPAPEQFDCDVCSAKAYGYCPTCPGAMAEAETKMQGHILRVHPEVVPEIVAGVARDPVLGAALRAQHLLCPALWQKLIDAMDVSLASTRPS